jgi:hypothetical protein
MRWVPTSDAAARLGVSTTTVIAMVGDGRLLGRSGSQPRRPRWSVGESEDGRLLDGDGQPIDGTQGAVDHPVLAQLVARLDALEASAATSGRGEPFRDAALLLNDIVDRQREVAALQTQAMQILSETVASQAQIIATLLVPDSPPVGRTIS